MPFLLGAIGWVTRINFGSVLGFLASPAGMISIATLVVFGAYSHGKRVEGAKGRAAVERSIEKAKGIDKDVGKDAAIQGAEDRAANAAADAERDRRIRDYETIIANLKGKACVLSADDVRRLERVRGQGTGPVNSVPLPPRRP